jgi:hypothetical protein
MRLIGIDRQSSGYHVADVREHEGRPEIVALKATQSDASWSFGDDEECRVAVAVPDDLVIIKHLSLTGAETDRRERALFELVQSLTGDESDYVYDVLGTSVDGLLLGAATRRIEFNERVVKPLQSWEGVPKAPFARMRALALGEGYRRFAIEQPGGVVVVADFDGARVSWCLLADRAPVSAGYLNTSFNAPEDGDAWRRFGAELRTSIEFRLAMLFDRGMTRPLAAVELAGDFPDTAVSEVGGSFTVPVRRARLNEGYLSAAVRDSGIAPASFFPALGLASYSLA